jgi:hypothetical protein
VNPRYRRLIIPAFLVVLIVIAIIGQLIGR